MDDLLFWAIGLGVLYMMFKATIAASSPGLQAFAQAIAGAEGFGVPGVTPTINNNPGDITDGQGNILSFTDPNAGWQYLYNFLSVVGSGQAPNPRYYPSMTIAEFAAVYTATQQTDWTNNVVAFLQQQGYPQATAQSPISTWLS